MDLIMRNSMHALIFPLKSMIKVKIGANIGLKKGDKSAPRQGATDTFLSTLSQAPTYGPQTS